MKKVFWYFWAFLFVCFLLPALLTKQDKRVNVDEIEETTQEQQAEEMIRNTRKDDNY